LKRYLVAILRNTLGVVCILAGIIMLMTPGQGILTIILGFSLLQFRGKKKIVAWMRRLPMMERIAQKLESLRRGKEPTIRPPTEAQASVSGLSSSPHRPSREPR